jgi:phosphate transport system protein
VTEVELGSEVDLERIDRQVIELFAWVSEGLAGATTTLLDGDRESAEALADRDAIVDVLYHAVEDLVVRQLADRRASDTTARFLLLLLRILPELERSGDLAEHIARAASRGVASEMSPRCRGLIAQMGEIGAEMWSLVTDAYAERLPGCADRLDEKDDVLDELHVMLTSELASGSTPLPVAVELALIGRFYERLGDHAVNLARRVQQFAAGGL